MTLFVVMRTNSPTSSGPGNDQYLLPQPPLPTHASSFPSSPLPTATSPPQSAFTVSAYAHPASPASPPPPVEAMSPDDMLRAYAVRSAANSSPAPPSAFAPLSSAPSSNPVASPKVKGRKLSIRASLGFAKKPSTPTIERVLSPVSIGYPMHVAPASPLPRPNTPSTSTGGMAGVGARGMGTGMAGVGAAGMAGVGVAMGMGAGPQYTIGEDEEYEDQAQGGYAYGDAYGGVN
ncbi:hypothetical protein H0H87_003470 [Tephrocybe sp. NHM501043]|nr:hypothetical protein H0H87_003470 [Tephrocybe sp. NHM501043]